MIVEGSGRVAPAKHPFVHPVNTLKTLHSEAKRRDEFRQYKNSSRAWKRGLLPEVVIPGVGVVTQSQRPIFSGLLGEYTTALYINRHLPGAPAALDLALRKDGDGGRDLCVFSVGIQVKLCQSQNGENLVRAIDERGRHVLREVHAFVFCDWNLGQVVNLRGWLRWAELINRDLVHADRGHQNLVVPCCDLNPMSQLVEYIDARRIAGCR